MEDSSGLRRRRLAIAAVAVLATVSAITAHRFSNGFVLDDPFVIERSDVIHDPAELPRVFTRNTMYVSSAEPGDVDNPVDTYRPITLVTFFWDAALSGRSPWAYHLTNTMLHGLCVLLVLASCLQMLGPTRWPFAVLGALWFGLSPWLAEAHVWINGRSDPVALAFGLGALLVIERKRDMRASLRDVTAGLLYLAALLGKEVMLATLPAVLLWPSLREPTRLRLRRAVPFAVAAAAYLGLRAAVLGGLRTHRDAEMLAEATLRLPMVWLDAVRLLLVPTPPYLRSLRDAYDALPTWTFFAAWVAAGLVALLVYRTRRRAPELPWIALWLAGSLAPVAIIATVLWPGFGRYLYVPAAGLAVGVALLTARVWERVRTERRPWLAVAAGAYLSLQALLLAVHTTDYRSNEALYQAAIAQRPDLAYGWGYLGMHHSNRGHPLRAIEALREAVARDPDEHRYLSRLGHSLAEVGARREAAHVAGVGLSRFAGRPEAASYHLMAVRAMTERDPRRAIRHLLECLRLRPGRPDCERALAQLLRTAPDRAANRQALEELLQDPAYRGVVAPYSSGSIE